MTDIEIFNTSSVQISGIPECDCPFIFKKQPGVQLQLSSPAKDNNMPRSFLITRSAATTTKPTSTSGNRVG